MNAPKKEMAAALESIASSLDQRYDGCGALAIAAGQYILSVRELTGVNHYSTKDPGEIIDRILGGDMVHLLDDQVNEIYQAYPRRRDPGATKRAIRKALIDTAIPHTDKFRYLLTAVRLYARQCSETQKETQYIPYPSTWMTRQSYLNAPKLVLSAMETPPTKAQPQKKDWSARQKDAAS